jgi:hypothetical protein
VYIRQHKLLKVVLQTLGLKSKDEFQVIFDDVHELFKRNGQKLEKRIEGALFFDEFQSYENINGQLKEWATAYPSLVTLSKIGSSVEGRDILCIGLSDYTQSSTKRRIFWLGGMHAREQIGLDSFCINEHSRLEFDNSCAYSIIHHHNFIKMMKSIFIREKVPCAFKVSIGKLTTSLTVILFCHQHVVGRSRCGQGSNERSQIWFPVNQFASTRRCSNVVF